MTQHHERRGTFAFWREGGHLARSRKDEVRHRGMGSDGRAPKDVDPGTCSRRIDSQFPWKHSFGEVSFARKDRNDNDFRTLEEADQLASRIAVIDHGKVIAEGTSSELKASVGSGVLHMRLADPTERDRAQQFLAEKLGEPVHPDGDPRALSVQLSDTDRAAAALSALSEAGIAVTDFSLGQPSLDEVFFALTGHAATENGSGDGDQPQAKENAA
jgi:hypothetical protein